MFPYFSFCPKKDPIQADQATIVTLNLHLSAKNQEIDLPIDASLSYVLLLKSLI